MLKAYKQQYSINDYLYQTDLPTMAEFTICFWFNGQADDDGRDDDWLISVATPGNLINY